MNPGSETADFAGDCVFERLHRILLETCVFDFIVEWQTYVYNIYIYSIYM